jgi:predicted ATPase
MNLAQGRQTLLTAAARAVLDESIPDGAEVRRHGYYRLKGVEDPVEIYEVGVRNVAPFLPPPDVEKAYRVVRAGDLWLPAREIPHNLPPERDVFVGRSTELAALAARFDNGSRLVTLLGSGGTGKTRLVRRYGWIHLGNWPGGVYFCDLSDARSREGIFFAVAAALEVPLGTGEPALQLGHAIAGRGRCLIILDNFEQVAQHAIDTLDPWLDRAAEAVFAVTSRERLHLRGEDIFPVEPLPLENDALELFAARARAQRPEFAVSDANRDSIRQVVRLLDGLPLAIELAAARARLLSPAQLVHRLRDRFQLLGGARHSDRQATMRAAIDWSWNLLVPWEQSALATCSVFEGSFTLRAAEAVLDLSAWADAPPIVDVIESLIDKSVLRASMPALDTGHELDEPQFGMFISVHEYASEKLDALGPDARRLAEERHGRFFAGSGTEESLRPPTAEEQIRHRRAHTLALDNLIVAFHRAVGRDDVETMVRAYCAIVEVLDVRGPIAVAVELGSQLPPLTPNADLLVAGHLSRARALWLRGQTDVAAGLLDAIIVLTREHGDRRREGVAQQLLGLIRRDTGRTAEACAHFERALLLHREVGDRLAEARVLNNLGGVYLDEARHDEAKACYRAAIEAHRAVENVGDPYRPLTNLALVAMNTGDLDEARRLWSESLDLSRRAGDRRNEGVVLANLGYLAEVSGRPREALVLTEAALVIHRQVGNRQIEGKVLGNLGMLQFALGEHDEAIRCFEGSLDIALEVGDRQLEGEALGALGQVCERQQHLDRARSHLERSIEIFRSLANRRSEGMALATLGSVLARLGMLDQARTALASGAELLRETNDPVELGKLLCGHAGAELDAGDRQAAKNLLAEAQEVADSLKSHEGSALNGEIAALRDRIQAWNC